MISGIYLVRGEIQKTEYMCSPERPFEDVRIVFADNVIRAQTKYEEYWYYRSDEYSYSYQVLHSVVTEPIK